MMQDDIQDSIKVFEDVAADGVLLDGARKCAEAVQGALLSGHKMLVAGNGGSAADAQHMAAEFVATFKREKRKGYPVIALSTDTSFLTAWSNDFDFSTVFARQVEALGRDGDIFFGISTSGNSKNIIEAMKMAKNQGMKTVALLGNGGGELKECADISLIVPSAITARIQEAHILLIHVVCNEVVPNLV